MQNRRVLDLRVRRLAIISASFGAVLTVLLLPAVSQLNSNVIFQSYWALIPTAFLGGMLGYLDFSIATGKSGSLGDAISTGMKESVLIFLLAGLPLILWTVVPLSYILHFTSACLGSLVRIPEKLIDLVEVFFGISTCFLYTFERGRSDHGLDLNQLKIENVEVLSDSGRVKSVSRS